MSFVTASYDYSGSYISGTTDAYLGSFAHTTQYVQPTYVYPSSFIAIMNNISNPGPSSHPSRPTKL